MPNPHLITAVESISDEHPVQPIRIPMLEQGQNRSPPIQGCGNSNINQDLPPNVSSPVPLPLGSGGLGREPE